MAVTSAPALSQPSKSEAAPLPDLLPASPRPVPLQPLDPLLGLRPMILAPVPSSVAPSVQTQGLGSENTQCQSLMPQSSTLTSAGCHANDHQVQQQTILQVKGGGNFHGLSLHHAGAGEALEGPMTTMASAVTSKSPLDSKHTAASPNAAAAAAALMAATSAQQQKQQAVAAAAAAAAASAMSAWRQQQMALQQMQALQTLGIPPYGFFHGSNAGGEAPFL